MTVSNVAASGGLTNRVVGRILRRCALAAIGASLGAISASTFAADSSTGPSGLSTFPSQTMPASHRAATRVLPDTKVGQLADHSRALDRLYEELMRATVPACLQTSTNASMIGGC
jgi:hypothetical protein